MKYALLVSVIDAKCTRAGSGPSRHCSCLTEKLGRAFRDLSTHGLSPLNSERQVCAMPP